MCYLYLFFCGAVLQAFEVNPQTGVVMATRELRTPVEYPLHVQVRDAGSPPLVADTWLTLRLNCSSAASAAAAARAPADDVVGRSQLGGMLLFVVVAAVASSLLLVCVLAASLVLRHCVSSRRLPTASKPPQSGHVTSPAGAPRGASSADSDDSTLKIARGCAMTSQGSWYPAHCNSLKAPHYPPPRTLAVASLPACSSVGRFRPMTAGTYSHVTPSGRSQQVPVTSSFADDVRYRLLYGANVVPTVQHSV